MRFDWLPFLLSSLYFWFRYLQIDSPLLDIKIYSISVLYQRDRTPHHGLRRNMTYHKSSGCTGKSSVGNHRNLFSKPLTNEGSSNGEHFPHSWTSLWAFIPYYHYIPLNYFSLRYCFKSVFLSFKDTSLSNKSSRIQPSNFDHSPVWRQRTLEDCQSTYRMNWIFNRSYDLLVRIVGGK